jgi:hypothetical protein
MVGECVHNLITIYRYLPARDGRVSQRVSFPLSSGFSFSHVSACAQAPNANHLALLISFAEKLLVCNARGTGRLVRASRHIKSRLEIQTLTPADSRHSREQEYGKLLQQQRRQATGNKKQQETRNKRATGAHEQGREDFTKAATDRRRRVSLIPGLQS